MIVAKLQAEVLALRSQLAQVRAVQYDEIHSLLDTRTPLNRLVSGKAEHEASSTDDPSGGGGVAAIATARLAHGKATKAVGAGRLNGNNSEEDHE
ncbi:hypothetical protein K7N18_32160 [Burkholderia arboris]|uniref:hypothetical protein n=1 Tax=Burkholderia arboris TaxID=488730 RepID=UPI001CA41637|nr:hypothetical protein [Burkholderia arboris]MBY8609476.1 hypothetical protein [Burkholderia arboris]